MSRVSAQLDSVHYTGFPFGTLPAHLLIFFFAHASLCKGGANLNVRHSERSVKER